MIRKTVFVMVVLAFLIAGVQAKGMATSTDPSSMTAGGYLDLYYWNGDLIKVHHTIALDCDNPSQSKLKVDWNNNVFQLDPLTVSLVPTSNAISGSGTGTLNGVYGATIEFSFTDNGDGPGITDVGSIYIIYPVGITDPNGVTEMFVGGPLDGGNYQMHN